MSDEDIAQNMREFDLDGNEDIDFEEFYKTIEPQLKSELSVDELREAFNLVDQDKSGYINQEEFAKLLDSIGFSYTPEQLQKLISKNDKNSDGRMSFGGKLNHNFFLNI